MTLVGDNPSGMEIPQFFTAPSPQELREQLRAIKTPYKVISIYSINSAHVAWIIPTLYRNKPGRKPKGENNGFG